jgi:hypothetical protein
MSNDTILDLDAMMDIEMDKVETLPDFVTPPDGAYTLRVAEAKIEKYKTKAKDNNPAKEGSRIRIQYVTEKTHELEKSSDLPVKDGSMFSESFMGTEEGLKYFKRQAINILNVKDLEGAKMKDVLDGLKDIVFKAKVTTVKTDDGKGGQYENVRIRPVHEAPVA